MKNSRGALVALALALCVSAPARVAPAQAENDEPLTLTGCLLLSRRVGIYALHMEYNRIAATGHADLANHVGHIVTIAGHFEEQEQERLMFLVDDVTHVASTCEAQASVSAPG